MENETEFKREISAIIGLAKSNENLEKIFVKEVLISFGDPLEEHFITRVGK